MQQGAEPSIEEILASIKKVMAREDGGPANVEGDRIGPADAHEASDVLDLADTDMVVDFDAQPGSANMPAAPLAAAAGLPGPAAASAIRESLAALERLSRPDSTTQPGGSADASLDALTRAMLRPMLTKWLEANLPDIVERLVQAEIVRIVERNR